MGHRRYMPKHLARRVMTRGGRKCATCGSLERLAIDHIVPLSAGGPTEDWNLQILCVTCNSRKGAILDDVGFVERDLSDLDSEPDRNLDPVLEA